ncbi:MAG: hypothetical protein RRB13_01540 [bacterium]|nr:hypothetical protein [bacterium]
MKNTILFLWALLMAHPVWAAVEVLGTTYSDPAHVAQVFEECLADLGPQSPRALAACLKNTQLFTTVQVRPQASGWRVEVRDRWSLLPIPVVVATEGQGTRMGGFVAERNFLGHGVLLLGGGIVGPESSTYLGLLEDPHFLSAQGYLRFSLRSDRRLVSLRAAEDEVLDRRDEDRLRLDLRLGRNLGPDLRAALSVSAQRLRFHDLQGGSRPEDLDPLWVGGLLLWDPTTYHFYFDEGFKGELEYQSETRSQNGVTRLDLGWQGAIWRDQALQLRLQADRLNRDDPRLAIQGGGALGARGVPWMGLWSGRYLTASIDYQMPIVYSSLGIATVAPFVDVGWIDLSGKNRQVTYQAWGLGGYFYLKEVSLPGLGILWGRNQPYADVFAKITLGFDL